MIKSAQMQVLFVSAEVAPFAKAGGLADVAGALPSALNNLGMDTRVMMPFYGNIKRVKKNNELYIICNSEEFKANLAKENIKIEFNQEIENVNVWETRLQNTIVYLVENQKYFSYQTIYEPDIKFLFFSAAASGILDKINFLPRIIHCNDNHTALIPALLKLKGIKMKTILTIHNLEFQGKMPQDDMKLFNIWPKTLSTLIEDAKDGDLNRMMQGILIADIVNTVSPTYAKEILTEEYGQGLNTILARRGSDLYGIINGIDMEKFNPANDPFLEHHYSPENLAGKSENKKSLIQKYFSNCSSENKIEAPVIGLISRLTPQKGIDLVTEALPEIFKKHPDIQFFILGTGIPEYETMLNELALKYPDNLKIILKFDLKTAQEIYAGADIFLMPSRFEPCGLSQLTAMRYGAVPIVRATGGLKDTVVNYKSQITSHRKTAANGFLFEEYSAAAMIEAIEEALSAFQDKKIWKELMINGMKRDSSWGKSAQEYIRLYKKLLR